MKKCPFCAEEIQDEALKCRFCGEFLNKQPLSPPLVSPREPWYYRTSMLIIAFITVGPFALPLVWKHPRYSSKTKIVVTVVILVLTYVTVVMTVKSIRSITEYYKIILG